MQKRPIILRSLLIVATPYIYVYTNYRRLKKKKSIFLSLSLSLSHYVKLLTQTVRDYTSVSGICICLEKLQAIKKKSLFVSPSLSISPPPFSLSPPLPIVVYTHCRRLIKKKQNTYVQERARTCNRPMTDWCPKKNGLLRVRWQLLCCLPL